MLAEGIARRTIQLVFLSVNCACCLVVESPVCNNGMHKLLDFVPSYFWGLLISGACLSLEPAYLWDLKLPLRFSSRSNLLVDSYLE